MFALICSEQPGGAIHAGIRAQDAIAIGAGWVEGWRGEILCGARNRR
ncbi:hypothetical protein ACU4GD_21040 [Cupriavidus basilensis]